MENILKKSYKMFINGKWVNSSNGIMVKTYAPYNNELLSEFPDASENDVDLAVKSAKEAFKIFALSFTVVFLQVLNASFALLTAKSTSLSLASGNSDSNSLL